MLPRGRASTLAELPQGFVLEYGRTRARAVGGRRRLERSGQGVSPDDEPRSRSPRGLPHLESRYSGFLGRR